MLCEILHITCSKEEEFGISVVLLKLLDLDPTDTDEIQDRFFALPSQERCFREQDPLGQGGSFRSRVASTAMLSRLFPLEHSVSSMFRNVSPTHRPECRGPLVPTDRQLIAQMDYTRLPEGYGRWSPGAWDTILALGREFRDGGALFPSNASVSAGFGVSQPNETESRVRRAIGSSRIRLTGRDASSHEKVASHLENELILTLGGVD